MAAPVAPAPAPVVPTAVAPSPFAAVAVEAEAGWAREDPSDDKDSPQQRSSRAATQRARLEERVAVARSASDGAIVQRVP